MQVFIARNLDNGNVLELDDLSFQFVLWLNENGFTELDDVYARSTLNTTVGEFNKLISAHSFEGEDEMLIPQLDYFVELNTWVSWTDDGPRDENEKTQDRVKALDVLNKMTGEYVTKIEGSVSADVNDPFKGLTTEELRKLAE